MVGPGHQSGLGERVSPRRLVEWGRARARSSQRLRVGRLVFQLCPGLGTGLVAWALASALVPLGMLVAMGRLVGAVPAATRFGFDSSAGHRLIVDLIVACVLLATTLLLAPTKDAMQAVVRARLTSAMQSRLIAAVSGPVGIAHLEDPSVLDRLELAQGALFIGAGPADAPAAYASIVASKLGGWLACLVVMTFHWWLGLGLLVFWVANRGPIRRQMVLVARSFAGEAGVMRRAVYFHQLVSRPQASKEVRIFGLGNWAVGQFRRNFLDGMTKVWKLQDRQALLLARLAVGMVVVYGIAFGVLADAVLSGSIGLASVATLIPVISMTMQAGLVTGDDASLEFSLAAFPHLEELERQLGAHGGTDSGARPVGDLPVREIRFRDVGFAYPGAERSTFEHLDITLPVGRSTAIVGANGAGKTTLVKLLARLHDPTTGAITVDGIDLRELRPREWQTKVAAVFQDFTQYPLSAADNVGLGAVAHLDARDGLEKAARRAGALDIIETLPLGWDTVLSREFTGGVDLSGGQWQRIALARALFAVEHGAKILVLDEPTAWLDVRGEAEFFDQFLEITRGLTSIVISHRFSTVRQADHICVIDQGLVVEEGSHDDLVARSGQYAEAFRLQASRFVDGEPGDGR